MNHDHDARTLSEAIKRLHGQREELRSSLNELLDDASAWEESKMSEFTSYLVRLSAHLKDALIQIKQCRAELIRMEQVSAEEFVRNYGVKPGSK